MSHEGKNWFERFLTDRTERLWNSEKYSVDSIIEMSDKDRKHPMSQEEKDMLRLYLTDRAQFHRNFSDKRDMMREMAERANYYESLKEQSKIAFKEFALSSGMRMNWNGTFYDPDTRTTYDDLGNEI